MRKFLLSGILVCAILLARSQFTYFNNTYSDDAQLHTFQFSVYNVNDGYLSLGTHGNSGMLCRYIDLNGIETQVAYDFHSTAFIGPQGPLSENLIYASSGLYGQFSIYNASGSWVPYMVKLNLDLDTVWTWKPDWVTGIYDDFDVRALTELDNGNILSVNSATFGFEGGNDQPDSIGLRFTQVHPDGYQVSSVVAIYEGDQFCNQPEICGVRQMENMLVLWGRAKESCPGNYQDFVLKTTMDGEIMDIFYWGGPAGPEIQFAGTLLEDDHLAFSYARCEDYNGPLDQLVQEHFMLFDPVTMTSIVDLPHTIPGIDVYGGSCINESIVKSSDGYAAVFRFLDVNSETMPYNTAWIWKADSDGQLQWCNEYVSGLDTDIEYLRDIENAPDGGYILTGTAEPIAGGQLAWMLKIDSCGYEQAGSCFPDGLVEEETSSPIKLWPNPAFNVLKAQLPLHADRITMRDGLGRTVLNERIYHPSQQWDIRFLEGGVYMLEVEMDDGSVVVERFVKG